MPQQHPEQRHGFVARRDQPLIGVLVREDEQELVRYFADEQEVDAAFGRTRVQEALKLAGAWKDLGDWAEVEEELDRIRHQSQPTPPIDEL